MDRLTFLQAGGRASGLVVPIDVMLEKGTSTEYLIECNSWTTTLDTLRNDNFLRWPPPAEPACPRALLTCNVLNNKGLLRQGSVSGAREQGISGTAKESIG